MSDNKNGRAGRRRGIVLATLPMLWIRRIAGGMLVHRDCAWPEERTGAPSVTVQLLRQDDGDGYLAVVAGVKVFKLPRSGRPRCENCMKSVTPNGYTAGGWREALRRLCGPDDVEFEELLEAMENAAKSRADGTARSSRGH